MSYCTHPCLHIRTAQDAHVVFEAVRQGILPLIRRRLSPLERDHLRSGYVFVWEEAEHTGGLSRWTDGRRWSQSRMREPFLFYEEKVLPTLEEKQAKAERRARKAADPNGPHIPPVRRQDRPSKPDGLTKQTYSSYVHLPGHSTPRKWHCVAYFSPTAYNTLPTVDVDDKLRRLRVPSNIYISAKGPGAAASAAASRAASAVHPGSHHAGAPGTDYGDDAMDVDRAYFHHAYHGSGSSSNGRLSSEYSGSESSTGGDTPEMLPRTLPPSAAGAPHPFPLYANGGSASSSSSPGLGAFHPHHPHAHAGHAHEQQHRRLSHSQPELPHHPSSLPTHPPHLTRPWSPPPPSHASDATSPRSTAYPSPPHSHSHSHPHHHRAHSHSHASYATAPHPPHHRTSHEGGSYVLPPPPPLSLPGEPPRGGHHLPPLRASTLPVLSSQPTPPDVIFQHHQRSTAPNAIPPPPAGGAAAAARSPEDWRALGAFRIQF